MLELLYPDQRTLLMASRRIEARDTETSNVGDCE
jgi:hypothetical protein